MIRAVKPSDADDICRIYNEYIVTSIATFEEELLEPDDITIRINKIIPHFPWLVYEDDETVAGYTYAGRWKERSAYRYSVEVGIYLDSNFVGKRIGSQLLEKLLDLLKEQSIHSVLYGVSLPNPVSVALCEKFGFEKVAHFREVGCKFDKWIDVGYWELILGEG